MAVVGQRGPGSDAGAATAYRHYGGDNGVHARDRSVDHACQRGVDRQIVNASPDAQLRLLDLQALDTTIDQLNHRRTSLPEHAELERLTARMEEVGREVVVTETEESDIAKEQGKAEADVEQVVARATRDQQRLDAGQVGSPRELENLQSEIASLGRRRSDLEDTGLEIMERREDVQRRLAALTLEREQLNADIASTTERRDSALADIERELGGAT